MRLFVTGTDTDAGKTRVTACLARAARARGTIVACKPVASGVTPGSAGEDAERLGAAAGHPPLVFAAFEAPLSPHRAAELEGRTLPDGLLERVAALRADTVLVEGVGGWRVPLRLEPPLWVEDLARATAGRVLVVAPDRVGVINQALLTVDAVRRSGLEVAAVALSRTSPTTDASAATNADDLRMFLGLPVVVVPWMPVGPAGEVAEAAAGEALWAALDPT
ncbi:MAG: dethiobiotin synthase [Alphaproteobacteria bacterium]|nr:dethiobiotin synthase [Alphaproteobacteria bacterium]